MSDVCLMLAQAAYDDRRDELAAGMLMMVMFIIFITLVIAFFVFAIVCLLLYFGYSPVPSKHKKMPAWQIFLLMIPIFNLFWNFRVFTAIPDSFRSSFTAQGRTEFGDCGRSIGMYLSIVFVLSFIPCLNYLACWVLLVLIIMFMVKLFNMRSALKEPPPAPVPPAPAA